MNEILAYISGYRRSVDICYTLPDGRKEKLYRKLDGSNSEAIKATIDELKARGIKNIIVDVYKPNGTAKVFDRSFTINNTTNPRPVSKPIQSNAMGSLPLFETPNIHKPIPMESWKDYALQTEREKVAKLEAENAKLKTENKSLDDKVRDFEKEMIRKDHEVQNLSRTVESKSGLNGFVEKASENPMVMNMLAGLATRMLGLPDAAQPALPERAGSPELLNPKSEQYIANIKTWLYKQPDEMQDTFYHLVYEVTNSKDVAGTCYKLINLLQNGTTIPNKSKVAS